jgi:predicted DCC family thiol-disulfide oxidoreductase YuxK
MHTTPPGRPAIVYDGQCPFCLRQVERIQSRDRAGLFEYIPRQAAGLEDRFPQLRQGDFNTGMRLVHTDGSVSVGADAVYQIARRLPGWRTMAWLYRVPGLRLLFRAAYAWIARNRYRLAGSCEDEACQTPGPGSTPPR